MPLVVSTDILTTENSDHAIDDGALPLYVAPGVLVAAQGNGASGIYSASYVDCTIAGNVFGNSSGIVAAEGGSVINVMASGSVSGTVKALQLIGSASILNAGSISGSTAIDLSMTGLVSALTNSGIIMGAVAVSFYADGPSARATIRNSGTIIGAFAAIDLGAETDIVTNSGSIQGDVRLGSGNDRFDSGAGIINGTVFGESGDDIIKGSAYDDILNGGTGADELYGGAGLDTASYAGSNSTIYVDMQNGALDTGDAAGDLFFSIENVEGGNRADQMFGNAGANVLSGGAANDRLDGRGGNDMLHGGTGADRMTGGLGDDVFSVDSADDLVFELANEGTDEVRSTVSYSLRDQYVERLTLLGADSIEGHGNAFDNVIVGNDAGNVLEGRLGKDIVTGKGGADQFLMTGAPGAANLDRITDFEIGIDKIAIDRSYYATVGPIGTLPNYAFGSATSPDASDRIFYNSANGVISYDADGSGPIAALPFAQVTAGLALSASDFLIVV